MLNFDENWEMIPTVVGIVGSFDPFTNGHLELVKRALTFSNNVVIIVGTNANKTPMFSADERAKMILVALKDILMPSERVKVRICPPGQFTAMYARELGITHFLRGIRTASDLEFESVVDHTNTQLLDGPHTLYALPPRNTSHISSSYVKGLIGMEYAPYQLEEMVPSNVNRAISYKYVLREAREAVKLITGNNDAGLRQVWSSFVTLIDRYDRVHRQYHNIHHLANMIAALSRFRDTNRIYSMMVIAAVLHDCVLSVDPDYHSIRDELNAIIPIDQKASDEELSIAMGEHIGLRFTFSQHWTNYICPFVLAGTSAMHKVQTLLQSPAHQTTASWCAVMRLADLSLLATTQRTSNGESFYSRYYLNPVVAEWIQWADAAGINIFEGRKKLMRAVLEAAESAVELLKDEDKMWGSHVVAHIAANIKSH